MFDENLSEFLDSDDFAVEALINEQPVNVIFENGYLELAGMQGVYPHILVRTVDLEGVAEGDTVVVNKTNYTFVYAEPDGTGISTAILRGV